MSRAVVQRARPEPAYANAEVRALSEQLMDARARKERLRASGKSTSEVDREVLEVRRKLRDGGQLRAGDDLGGGRYVLIRQLGRGGFAVVWEADDTIENRAVAIKVLHHHLAGDQQRRERFFRGARVMAELDHPSVVRVLEPRGEDEHFCYFVMELVPGGNLREAVLDKRVDPSRTLPLIIQVGEALGEAHRRGLVHRDVKPANIMLDEHGNAKLTDFDLVSAADTTGGTRTGAMGTVVYAAPECLDKPQEATARADVFGLGMTAIFCLLRNELSAETFRSPEATIHRLDCAASVQTVLARAVAWAPNLRYASGTAVVNDLRRSLAAGGNQQQTTDPAFKQGSSGVELVQSSEPSPEIDPVQVRAATRQAIVRTRAVWAALGFFGMAATAVIVARFAKPEPNATLDIRVVRRPIAGRSPAPAIGDTLIVDALLAGEGELRVYDGAGTEQARCASPADNCHVEHSSDRRVLELTMPLTRPGQFRAVLFSGQLPDTARGFEADLDSATRANFITTAGNLIVVN